MPDLLILDLHKLHPEYYVNCLLTIEHKIGQYMYANEPPPAQPPHQNCQG